MKKSPRRRGPAAASLQEIPELAVIAKLRPNRYAKRVATEGIEMIRTGRGRPRKGEESGPTIPRSVRFPAPVWARLEKRAKAQGLTLHAALRVAIIEWIGRP